MTKKRNRKPRRILILESLERRTLLSANMPVAGDANLDGTFDSTDLVQVLVAGEFEDGVSGNSTWAEGDWNGDHDFNKQDLVFALQGGQFDAGMASAQLAPAAQTGPVGGADAGKTGPEDLADTNDPDPQNDPDPYHQEGEFEGQFGSQDEADDLI